MIERRRKREKQLVGLGRERRVLFFGENSFEKRRRNSDKTPFYTLNEQWDHREGREEEINLCTYKTVITQCRGNKYMLPLESTSQLSFRRTLCAVTLKEATFTPCNCHEHALLLPNKLTKMGHNGRQSGSRGEVGRKFRS